MIVLILVPVLPVALAFGLYGLVSFMERIGLSPATDQAVIDARCAAYIAKYGDK